MPQASNLTAELLAKHCRPDVPGLSKGQATKLLTALKGWHITGKKISKTFSFKDYYHTMAFVNAIAYVSHQQDHHPDLEVGYNRCVVHYSSHDAGGLSENDFICAVHVDTLE
jgi:4a-hydroxytetrahydrobiopterin dehydratase